MVSYEKISKKRAKEVRAKVKKMNKQGESSKEMAYLLGVDQHIVDQILTGGKF